MLRAALKLFELICHTMSFSTWETVGVAVGESTQWGVDVGCEIFCTPYVILLHLVAFVFFGLSCYE